MFDQKLPGYKKIVIRKASGLGSNVADMRVIEVKVLLENGEKPVACEGKALAFTGDPGASGFFWQTLECEGTSTLIHMAQSAIRTSYDPSEVYYPPNFSCYKNQIASVLYHWVKNGRITIDRIGWPEIKSLTEEMLAGKIRVENQIVLFDPTNREVIDLTPQEPADQKGKQYFLRCDSTLLEYRAKTYLDIYNYRTANTNEEYQLNLKTPLPESEGHWFDW